MTISLTQYLICVKKERKKKNRIVNFSVLHIIFYLGNNRDNLIDSLLIFLGCGLTPWKHLFEKKTPKYAKLKDYFLSIFHVQHAITILHWCYDMFTNFTNPILNDFIQQWEIMSFLSLLNLPNLPRVHKFFSSWRVNNVFMITM